MQRGEVQRLLQGYLNRLSKGVKKCIKEGKRLENTEEKEVDVERVLEVSLPPC